MIPPSPDHHLPPLVGYADAAAARLCRRLGLSPADHDDLRQELLVDLTRRLDRFDPSRGSLGGFAWTVMRNWSAP